MSSEPASAKQSRRERLTTALIALVAIVAIIGGLASRQTYDASGEPVAPTSLMSGPFAQQLTVGSEYGQELGPYGQSWVWLGEAGWLTAVSGVPSQYVAVRAFSHKRDRKITIGGQSAAVTTEPQTLVLGPVTAVGNRLPIAVTPGPQRAAPRDPRKVSVQLTTALSGPQPAFALPGKGVFPREADSAGPFHWLGRRAVFDVIAKPTVRTVNIRLTVRSPLQRDLTIAIAGAGARRYERTTVRGGDQDEPILIRGVALENGAARMVLAPKGTSARPGAGPKVFLQVRALVVES